MKNKLKDLGIREVLPLEVVVEKILKKYMVRNSQIFRKILAEFIKIILQECPFSDNYRKKTVHGGLFPK